MILKINIGWILQISIQATHKVQNKIKNNVNSIVLFCIVLLCVILNIFSLIYVDNLSSKIQVFGLTLDILGSWFVLGVFFSLFVKRSKRIYYGSGMFPIELSEKQILNDSLGVTFVIDENQTDEDVNKNLSAEELTIYVSLQYKYGEIISKMENNQYSDAFAMANKEQMLKHLKKQNSFIRKSIQLFYQKIGRDALIGFICLFLGFFLQIVSQFIEK